MKQKNDKGAIKFKKAKKRKRSENFKAKKDKVKFWDNL